MYRRDSSAAETRIDFHNHKPTVIEVADKLDGHSTAQPCYFKSAFHKFYSRPVLNGYRVDNLASGNIATHARTDCCDKPAADTDIAVDGDFLAPVYALLNQIFGIIKTRKVILAVYEYNAFRSGAAARFGDELADRVGMMICRGDGKMLRFKECSSLYLVEHQLGHCAVACGRENRYCGSMPGIFGCDSDSTIDKRHDYVYVFLAHNPIKIGIYGIVAPA